MGSLAGGACSLTALLPKFPFGINIAVDILFAALIVFISFGKAKLKFFVKRVIVYFTFSFCFCGIMIFIYLSFKPSGMEIYNDVIYFNISPIVLIILTLICYYIMLIIKKVTGSEIGNSICNIEITLNQKPYIFSAKTDTGCNIKEPFSGDSVIVAEKSLFNGIIFDDTKSRIIPFESLGGNGIVKGIKAECIKIDGKKIDEPVYIGFCDNVLKGDVKALVPFELIKDIKQK